MERDLVFRTIEPGDGPALGALIASSPSTGPTSFTYDYQADALEIHKAFAVSLHGIVATLESRPIGMAFGEVLDVQWRGRVRQAAYISNLRVHRARYSRADDVIVRRERELTRATSWRTLYRTHWR